MPEKSVFQNQAVVPALLSMRGPNSFDGVSRLWSRTFVRLTLQNVALMSTGMLDFTNGWMLNLPQNDPLNAQADEIENALMSAAALTPEDTAECFHRRRIRLNGTTYAYTTSRAEYFDEMGPPYFRAGNVVVINEEFLQTRQSQARDKLEALLKAYPLAIVLREQYRGMHEPGWLWYSHHASPKGISDISPVYGTIGLLLAMQRIPANERVSFVDVGSRNGIVAIAAEKLGWKTIWAIEKSIPSLAQGDNLIAYNLRKNHASERVQVFQGSLERFSAPALERAVVAFNFPNFGIPYENEAEDGDLPYSEAPDLLADLVQKFPETELFLATGGLDRDADHFLRSMLQLGLYAAEDVRLSGESKTRYDGFSPNYQSFRSERWSYVPTFVLKKRNPTGWFDEFTESESLPSERVLYEESMEFQGNSYLSRAGYSVSMHFVQQLYNRYLVPWMPGTGSRESDYRDPFGLIIANWLSLSYERLTARWGNHFEKATLRLQVLGRDRDVTLRVSHNGIPHEKPNEFLAQHSIERIFQDYPEWLYAMQALGVEVSVGTTRSQETHYDFRIPDPISRHLPLLYQSPSDLLKRIYSHNPNIKIPVLYALAQMPPVALVQMFEVLNRISMPDRSLMETLQAMMQRSVTGDLLIQAARQSTSVEIRKTAYRADFPNRKILEKDEEYRRQAFEVRDFSTVGLFLDGSAGSGTVIAEDEEDVYVLTNAHVVRDQPSVSIRMMGKSLVIGRVILHHGFANHPENPFQLQFDVHPFDVAIVALKKSDIPSRMLRPVRLATLVQEAHSEGVFLNVVSGFYRTLRDSGYLIPPSSEFLRLQVFWAMSWERKTTLSERGDSGSPLIGLGENLSHYVAGILAAAREWKASESGHAVEAISLLPKARMVLLEKMKAAVDDSPYVKNAFLTRDRVALNKALVAIEKAFRVGLTPAAVSKAA